MFWFYWIMGVYLFVVGFGVCMWLMESNSERDDYARLVAWPVYGIGLGLYGSVIIYVWTRDSIKEKLGE